MEKQESSLLQLAVEAAPYIYEMNAAVLNGNRSMLTITDTQKYLFSLWGKDLDLGIRPGNPVKEGSGARRCMDSREVVSYKVDKAVYGIPYMVYALPLIENGNVVGAISAGINTQKYETIKETLITSSTNLGMFSTDIFNIMRTFSSKSNSLCELGHEMTTEAIASNEKVKVTAEFMDGINNIASQINVLGINAAIQAAKSQQKGFSIISEEIRRLSEHTKGLVDQILPFLLDIKNRSLVIEKKSDLISTQSTDLSKTADEVLGSLNKLTSMMEEMQAQSMQL